MQLQSSSPSQAAAPALEYVGVGRRLVALIVDTIILVIAIWIIDAIFHFDVVLRLDIIDAVSNLVHMGPAVAIRIIIPSVYYVVMEAMLGATVGKMVLGIRIVKLNGSPIGWGESIMRNLLRLIDLIPHGIPYLLGAILIWTSPTRQRLGDRVAHTVVVRRRSAR